ncbi:hypothetical protein EGW08_006952 [Elysia chlorotica]|uniref:Lysosome-associated membrane glycoprotein 5 n=1 Tax=Elysia chlorotica TaxID=188477 RepID=A0A3S1BNZ2_ELYCH|nr:hypothetical protein EGW08_006952 [Elysia chlorotica]
MKAFIVTILLAVASATEFSVKKDGKVCALLKLDGSLELETTLQDTVVKKELSFDDATLIENSTCNLIKLNLTSSAEMWFQFDEAEKGWKVTPVSLFVPEMVFGKDVNDTDPVTLKASALAMFPKDSYYKCNAASEFNFVPETETVDFNYTVTAKVMAFEIQSADADKFEKLGLECAADPTEYVCKIGNKTMIVMEGNFTVAITYLNKTGANVTETIVVPAPEDAQTQGTCEEKASTESLTIGFFKTWAIDFTFTKSGDNYYISNINVTYTFDEHLPQHALNGTRTVQLPLSTDYLKASTKGYYICNSELDKSKDGVTLTSKSFKYRAFDDEEKGFDGDVSECSADESSSSVVPIAVGAALAGLVVIVLVAYLIGRKRTRKTGYESV